MRFWMGFILVGFALNAALACSESEQRPSELDRAKQAQALMQAEVTKAGSGTVRELVVAAMSDAKRDGRRLVVYVGASWCEPCQYFLEAVDKGLPPEFSNLRFLKFDNDADETRLGEAGYGGSMIPRFVVPNALGAGGLRFEGSIKGAAAIDDLLPKLRRILIEP